VDVPHEYRDGSVVVYSAIVIEYTEGRLRPYVERTS